MGRRKQTKRTKIINAAWRLFKANGYDNTTVEDIIRASKTSKGTFYHYFKGKSALLNTLSQVFDNAYEEYSDTITPEMSMSDILLDSNTYLFQLIQDDVEPELLASLLSSQIITDDYKCLLDDDRFYFQFVRKTISNGLESGEFQLQEGSTDWTLFRVYTMYERSILYDWVLHNEDYYLPDFSRKMLEPVITGFRKGIY